MGASIHMHLETKLNGQWHHFAAPYMLRDGTFFDFLAGIYDPNAAIVPTKGLPTDMSFVTEFCYKQDEQSYRPHHASWLDADELHMLQDRLNHWFEYSEWPPQNYDIDEYLHTLINGNSVISHQGWDDVRLVFWFDN